MRPDLVSLMVADLSTQSSGIWRYSLAFTSPSLGSRTASFVVKTVGPELRYWQLVV